MGPKPAEQGTEPPTKWYFALNQTAVGSHGQLAMAAVASAKANTVLEPHLLYDGDESAFTEWMIAQGVTVIHHRLSFADEVLASPPHKGFRPSTALGAYLRTDLPLVEHQAQLLLYTDVDVVFLRPPSLSGIRPKLAAAAREVTTATGRLTLQPDRFNTGVMVMNLPAFRERRAAFLSFVVDRQFAFPAYDQGALNAFFGDEVDDLPTRLNHRPSMPLSKQTEVLHFHGVKPSQLLALLDGRDGDVPGPSRRLFGANPAACALALEAFLTFLPRESREVIDRALASSTASDHSAPRQVDPGLRRLVRPAASDGPPSSSPSRGQPQVLIHIGLGQTAGTAQRLFRYGRLVLAQQGLYYPLTGLAHPTGIAHDALAAAAADTDPPPTGPASHPGELHEMAERLRAEIDRAGIERVLLSSRVFARLTGRQILRLAAALGDVALTPVLQLRNQRDWLEELYAEHLCATGGASRSARAPRDFVASCPLRYDYPAMVREWNRVAVDRRSLVLSLERLHDRDDPVGRLLTTLDVDGARTRRALKAGARAPFHPATAYLAGELRRAGRRDAEIEAWLAAMNEIGVARSTKAAARLFPEELQAELLARYHRDKLLLVTDPMLARCLSGPLPDVSAAAADGIADLPEALLRLAESIQQRGPSGAPQPVAAPIISLRSADDADVLERRRPGRVIGHLDEPRAEEGVLPPQDPGLVPFRGWVCGPNELDPAAALAVLRLDPLGGGPRDGRVLVFTRNRPRSDVHRRLPGIAEPVAEACGFDVRADLQALAPGSYALRLGLLTASGVAYQSKARTIEICALPSRAG